MDFSELRSRYKPCLSWSQALALAGECGVTRTTFRDWVATKNYSPLGIRGRNKWPRDPLIRILQTLS